jgi:DNA-binding transcriptional ArsR family regulator
MFAQPPSSILERAPGSSGEAAVVPPTRSAYSHDMSHDNVMTAPRNHDMSHDMSCAVAEIEARIDEIEREMASIAPLVHERERLLRARAMIRGEPTPHAAQTLQPRITREAVFEFLTRHPGASAGEIASRLDVGQGAVSAHLYRGKGRFFASRGGRWFPVPASDLSA